ncbi:hypothetical protein J1N35_039667 [Gossypium stocksii]|uniref:Uncharacterized protein n=1 Tax=Gossypium stocksii TaxID=47602 RepID=A0A9D3UC55_9ROSI|nr:hypothetical protein J1N35_039667 [Gossypium stocksii]
MGEIIAMGENFIVSYSFDKIDILIRTKHIHKIEEVITLEVGCEKFPICVTEKYLVENSDDKNKKRMELKGREEEASSETDQIVGSDALETQCLEENEVDLDQIIGMENSLSEGLEAGCDDSGLMHLEGEKGPVQIV